MKAVLAGDLHASDRAPSSCTDTYRADVLDLLHQAVSLATAHQAPLVLAGDIFHLKAPGRNSHRLILDLIRVLQRCQQDVWVVPGNHDMQHDRIESLLEGQPLGVLALAGVVHILDGWMSETRPIYGMPWQQHWTMESVWAALAGYREQLERGTGSQAPLVVAHAPLYPPGRELPYEFFPAADFAEAMDGRGFCFYGHVHEPHGVYQVATEDSRMTVTAPGLVTFCNYGALSRGSLHEYNLDRQVGVTVWDSDRGIFEFVPLHARPAAEVFRLGEVAESLETEGRLADFLAAIDGTDLQVVSIETVLEYIKSLDGVGKDEADLIEELLSGADK